MSNKILVPAVQVNTGDIVKFAGLEYEVVQNAGTFIGEREMTLLSTLLPTSPVLIMKLYNETIMHVKRRS